MSLISNYANTGKGWVEWQGQRWCLAAGPTQKDWLVVESSAGSVVLCDQLLVSDDGQYLRTEYRPVQASLMPCVTR